MAKRGRPSDFTPEVAQAILAELEAGKTLRAICAKSGMPHRVTVHRWLNDPARADFRNQYARSRDIGLDVMADELLRIASTPKPGKVTKTADGVVEVTEADMLGHRRLVVDTMKWYLGKMAPRRYGDRLQLDASVAFDRSAALRRAREARQASEAAAGQQQVVEMPTGAPEPEAPMDDDDD